MANEPIRLKVMGLWWR